MMKHSSFDGFHAIFHANVAAEDKMEKKQA